ncbi:MAG: NTP transferase domain-containing protein, partial [Pleurocapsa sp. SU_196_0]|nr:NTP transferase domain-containing protein [Pleurocapsa sp. SU_196_0]
HAGGLHGLTRALEMARFERVAVTACDMPNLNLAYWQWLLGSQPADIIIPENPEGFLEPLAAVYTKTCLEAVKAALEAGNLKMTGWWYKTSLRLVRVPWLEVRERFGEAIFLNANTPTDLRD